MYFCAATIVSLTHQDDLIKRIEYNEDKNVFSVEILMADQDSLTLSFTYELNDHTPESLLQKKKEKMTKLLKSVRLLSHAKTLAMGSIPSYGGALLQF